MTKALVNYGTSAGWAAHLDAVASTLREPCDVAALNRDPVPGFYVSVMNDDTGRRALAEGPFETHMEALVAVDGVKDAWFRVDPRAPWYFWGTARVCGDKS